MLVKHALQDLDFGNSVAEFDKQLEKYFVETQPFLDLIGGRRDIIAGDKGTGKTAIFKVLHQRYSEIPYLKNIIVVPAFNLSGDSVFQAFSENKSLDEAEYRKFWKAYILSVIGNWLLKTNKYRPRSKLHSLDILLRGLNLRSDADGIKPIFAKVYEQVGTLFSWKSLEFGIEPTETGFAFKPKVELADKTYDSARVSIDKCLTLLNDCLSETGKTVWLALDRLDEAFQGIPEAEIPALRALFRTYLDVEEYSHIVMKLFIRRDLFARVIDGGFVNLTHLNARKIELRWDEDDLKTLLCRRIKQNGAFCKKMAWDCSTEEQVFSNMFPDKVDPGSKKPGTWVWMMSRVRDGNNVKPPRNLIDLVSFAREAQLRREDRSPRTADIGVDIIESESLRLALAQLSETRVNDTLLAEAKGAVPLIEKFRRGKAEHSLASLAKVLGVKVDNVSNLIQPLVHIGFLGINGSNYKIPTLYRSGLEITQGKAQGVKSVPVAVNDDDDNDG